jgi:hypothetical protein
MFTPGYSLPRLFFATDRACLWRKQIDKIFISGETQKSMRKVKRGNKVSFYIDGHFIDEFQNSTITETG